MHHQHQHHYFRTGFSQLHQTPLTAFVKDTEEPDFLSHWFLTSFTQLHQRFVIVFFTDTGSRISFLTGFLQTSHRFLTGFSQLHQKLVTAFLTYSGEPVLTEPVCSFPTDFSLDDSQAIGTREATRRPDAIKPHHPPPPTPLVLDSSRNLGNVL